MPPFSLQTYIASSQQQPPAISVDPRGFKTALQSLIQFLIANRVAATLWLKLPKDDAWWEDIWQYGQQAAGCSIYSLGSQTGSPPDNLAASLRPLSIEQDTNLKREYLCLAVAETFTGVLFATRNLPDAPASDKRTLKLYCSMSPKTAGSLARGMRTLLESSCSPGELAGALSGNVSERFAPVATESLLARWETLFPSNLLNCETLPLTEAFLSWQLQFQEDLRSQLAAYRSSAKSGPALDLPSLDFLSQARQQLQSPLTTIKTALTLLGSPSLKLAQRQKYLEMIGTQCDRQKALIDSIVDLLQIQTTAATPPQALQLADIIPGIVSTYQPIAEEKGIMLAYTVPPNLSEVMGIEAELKQIVIHLLQNGIQITPQGGRVWVAAVPHNANFIALTVQDSGEGIAKAEVAKLFEAFYRHPTSHEESAGLGLTLVNQLVQRMGGSISVNSTASRGTTFEILLPVHHVGDSPAAHLADSSQAGCVSAATSPSVRSFETAGPVDSASLAGIPG